MRRFLLPVLFVFSFLLFGVKKAMATHCMGADIEYTCTGVDASGHTMLRVKVTFYRDCGPAGAPSSTAPITISVNATASGCGSSFNTTCTRTCPPTTPGLTACEVSPFCPAYYALSCCHSNAPGCFPGVQKYVFEGTLTLPVQCSNWILSYEICCRNNSITNLVSPGSRTMRIEAMVNNSDTICSSSPVFTASPVPYICDGQPYSYNHGAVDPDGDSLYYQLVDPMNAGGAPIPFVGGYTATYPLSCTGPFVFNNFTGQMDFTPNGTQFAVVALKISKFRNGVLLGYVRRDIQIVVLSSTLCNTSIPEIQVLDTILGAAAVDTVTVQVCPNTPMHLTIPVYDPGHNNLTLSSSLTSIPAPLPGASFGHYGLGDTVIAWMSWTPTYLDTGCHYFVINATNDACPYTSTSSKVFEVCVDKQVVVNPDSAVYCGTPVQLHATGGAVYSWTNSGWLINATTRDPLAQPPVSTWFTYASECGADSAWITYNPPFLLDAGPNDSICRNGQAFLNATVDPLYAPYTFNWQPDAGLLDPISGLPNDTIPNPVASPYGTTTYYCYMTGNNGCVRYDSLTVYITGVAPNVIATAVPDTICPGDPVDLTAFTQPDACGINGDTCTGITQDYTAGTSTTITGGSPTQYPTLYGNWNKSARHQVLYLASDLLPIMGGSGGKITAIAFDIGTFQAAGTGVLHDFTIKMKCTDISSLDDWEGGLTTVFDPQDVTPVAGWNIHVLDHPYDWDGTSNLVVDFCFYNPTTSALLNHKLRYTSVPYNCMLWTYNNTPECNTNVLIAGLSTYRQQRFNTRFTVCQNNFLGSAIQWQPSTGPNAPVNPNTDSTTSNPIDVTLYTIDVTTSGCTGSSFVNVAVDTNTRLSIGSDTSVCDTMNIRLTSFGTGTLVSPHTAFTYNWVAIPPDPSLTTPTLANPIVRPVQNTTYIVTLTGGACQLTDSIHVYTNFIELPSTYVKGNVSCNGANDGDITIYPTGNAPFPYNWSHTPLNTNYVNNLAPGTYYVTITDATFCVGRDTIIITQPLQLTLALNHTNVPCAGDANGSVTALAGGGCCSYDFNWSGGLSSTASHTGLSGGTYAVTVTDDSGCTISDTAFVIEYSALTLSVLTTNATINSFNDGTANETIGGGNAPYILTWGPGAINPDSLYAGTYWLIVTDSNGCTVADTFTITDPPPVFITFTQLNNPCYGDSLGEIHITSVTGGIPPYSYSWNTTPTHPGDTLADLSGLSAGTYIVFVSDSVGVTVSRNITITQPLQLSVSFDSLQPSCFGFSDGWLEANVTGGTQIAGGGYTYNWNTVPAQTTQRAIILTAGTYTVTVTDSNGCTVVSSYTLHQPDVLNVSFVSAIDVICPGTNTGSVSIAVNGGTPTYSFNWNSGFSTDSTLINAPAGTYHLTLTDANGCTDTVSHNISNSPPVTFNMYSDSTRCFNSTDGSAWIIVTSAPMAYTYVWSTSGTNDTITNLAAATYSATVTDTLGCTASQNVSVSKPDSTHYSWSVRNVSCYGGNTGTVSLYNLVGSGPFTYLWSTSSVNDSIFNLAAGNYSVVITDSKGCLQSRTFAVGQNPPVNIVPYFLHVSCNGLNNGMAAVVPSGGASPYTYNWSTGSVNDSIFGLSPGWYSVTVTDAQGCTASDSISINEPAAITNSLVSDSVSCFGYNDGSIIVNSGGGIPPYAYSLNGLAFVTSNYFSNLNAGTYSIVMHDFYNCADTLYTLIGEPAEMHLNVMPDDTIIVSGDAVRVNTLISPYTIDDLDNIVWMPSEGLNCSYCIDPLIIPQQENNTYILIVTYNDVCHASDTLYIVVKPGTIYAPTAFSPNGDGLHDVFKPVASRNIEIETMQVYSRWGEQVFNYPDRAMKPEWDGIFKEEKAPVATYVFIITGRDKFNGREIEIHGNLTLLR